MCMRVQHFAYKNGNEIEELSESIEKALKRKKREREREREREPDEASL